LSALFILRLHHQKKLGSKREKRKRGRGRGAGSLLAASRPWVRRKKKREEKKDMGCATSRLNG